MPDYSRASHAVDVGGCVVEPGGRIPANADAATVAFLKDRGLIYSESPAPKLKKKDDD